MRPTELLQHLKDALERAEVPYAVVGSLASSFYGESRLTNDIDVLADLRVEQLPAFLDAFPAQDFYVSKEAALGAMRVCGQFNIIHPESGLKVDVIVPSKSEFDRQRLQRRIRATLRDADVEAYFAAPEDVILKKLEFYREGGSEKHLRDIAGMLKVSGERIDRNYIAEWATKLGVSDVWNLILSRVGES